MAVSVCIPTYKRHDLVVYCVESAVRSSVRPLEVVVSDDAHEPELAARLAALTSPSGVEIRYVANHLGRRQAANVRNAFEHASHELVVLMHDDDYFLYEGLDKLLRAWYAADNSVDAVYGRQQYVDAAGNFLPEATARWNRKTCRLEPGVVPSNLWAALIQQFPMNGMMIRRSLALTAGVPPEDEVGRHTDLHFAIRYALTASRSFLLIDADVAAYRKSPRSISRAGEVLHLDGHLNYGTIKRLQPTTTLERRAHRRALERAAGEAVLALLTRGERRAAAQVFGRHWWGMRESVATRLKLGVLLAGAFLGIRWPETLLRRRRLGLPDLQRLARAGWAHDDRPS